MPQTLEQPAPVEQDFLPLNGTDYVEFYVGNARQAAHYYRTAFGFRLAAYRGPETGMRDRASYVLVQDKIRFVLTTPLQPDGEIAEHVRAARRWRPRYRALGGRCRGRLARDHQPRRAQRPRARDPARRARRSAHRRRSRIYGDTDPHASSSAATIAAPSCPASKPVTAEDTLARPVGLKYIDHMVGNVGWGEMNRWVDFYRDVMGFRMFKHFDDNDISTEYSALMSKVMSNGNERVKFPINEPAAGQAQIADRRVSGVLPRPRRAAYRHGHRQHHRDGGHAARARAWIFCACPPLTTTTCWTRIGPIDEPIDELKQLGILVDRDDEGYMLQIFTRPVEDRPTLFYEVIQRKGSRSFGKGNFKALFEAIEREQARRGNL